MNDSYFGAYVFVRHAGNGQRRGHPWSHAHVIRAARSADVFSAPTICGRRASTGWHVLPVLPPVNEYEAGWCWRCAERMIEEIEAELDGEWQKEQERKPMKIVNGPMTWQEIGDIKRRLAAASPGPWGWWDLGESSGGYDGPDMVSHCGDACLPNRNTWGLSREEDQMGIGVTVLEFPEGAAHTPTVADATLIAFAPQDIARLIEEVERLRGAVHLMLQEALSTIPAERIG